jgi:hypothetical protein
METETMINVASAVGLLIWSVLVSIITNWWNKKSTARKGAFIKDSVAAVRDGKLTGEEFLDIVENHITE